MILPGTYANGFAPRDGEPLFPELWRGCVGAWNPGLGPTGTRLYDWSAFKNHGTLTNITAQNCWKISEGQHAMEFVSSTDQSVQISSAQNQLSLPPKAFWVSAWARPTASGGGAGREIFSKFFGTTSPFISYGLDFGGSGSGNRWRFNLGVAGPSLRLLESSSTFDLNRWYYVAGIYDGTNQSLYVNGVLAASRAESADVVFSTQPLAIARWIGNTDINEAFIGQIGQITLRNYVPSLNLLSLETAIGPGGMYQLAPRNWSAQQIAAYRARYYSQVIGSGVI
jgi:hypothetical protein